MHSVQSIPGNKNGLKLTSLKESQLRLHSAACIRSPTQYLRRRVCVSNVTRSLEIGSVGLV